MTPEPKDGFLQVDLVGIEPKLPYVARNPGYDNKYDLFSGELQISFPRSSSLMISTSLGHQYSYEMK